MALQSYAGALIIVSHDRHLLSACVDRILVVSGGALTEFDGDLEDYRRARQKEQRGEDRARRPAAPKSNRKEERRADAAARNALRSQMKPTEKQLSAIETLLARLGRESEATRAALSEPSVYDNAQRDRLKELTLAEARLKSELARAEDDWLHASARLEALRAEASEALG